MWWRAAGCNVREASWPARVSVTRHHIAPHHPQTHPPSPACSHFGGALCSPRPSQALINTANGSPRIPGHNALHQVLSTVLLRGEVYNDAYMGRVQRGAEIHHALPHSQLNGASYIPTQTLLVLGEKKNQRAKHPLGDISGCYIKCHKTDGIHKMLQMVNKPCG